MKTKKMYPALYRWAYATRRENEFLSKGEQKKIPKQTKHNWRNVNANDIFKLEQELDIREKIDALTVNELKEEGTQKRAFYWAAKLHLSSVKIIGKDRFVRLMGKEKSQFVALIEDFSKRYPKAKLLKWFHVSQSRYNKWYAQDQLDCQSSKNRLCAKKFPMQITQAEYNRLEFNLAKEKYKNWPLSSIHSKLLRNGNLSISRATFYRYSKLLIPHRNFTARKPKFKPLRAKYPNEIWHADFSKFRTRDGQMNFIFMIIDNYSRKILSWRCETTVSKHHVASIIIEAAEKLKQKKLKLITDAGTENVNYLIQEVLQELNEDPDSDIEHKIALKDIVQSNSMIERIFRVLKSNYLYKNIPENHLSLKENLRKFELEYNYDRPHHSLSHLTPHEAYIGHKIQNLYLQIMKAIKERKKVNMNCPCKVCDCQLK